MSIRILIGDVRERLAELPSDHFDCVVTSPPYWGLRDYGVVGQIGLEPTLGEHLEVMVGVMREVRRVLKPTGTLWLNYGDCYATAPNGRSAADTKLLSPDDRTFRDKPFSTVGPIYEQQPDSRQAARRGRSGNLGNGGVNGVSLPSGRVVASGILKAKDLCMVPNRLAIALQDDGWWVRSEIIWAKPNPMPESITDRPATAHEKIWLLTKSARYFYDDDAVRVPAAYANSGRTSATKDELDPERKRNGSDGNAASFRAITETRNLRNYEGPRTDKQRGHSRRHAGFNARWDAMSRQEQCENGRNLRNFEPAPLEVWPIATAPFKDAHFATFPPELALRCLKAGCPHDGLVLDPFGGAGTVGLVADRLGVDCTLIEMNPEYAALALRRVSDDAGMFADVTAE